MISRCTPRFWKRFHALPQEVQQVALKNYTLWCENPRHRSLRFKQLQGDVWSVRVGIHYRALGVVKADQITWFWIGTHADYDQLIR